MPDDITRLSKKAAKIILSFPKSTRIRVISHYDADGITAAAIMSQALHRAGYNFHTTLMRNPFIQGLERVKKEGNELIIFTDMGSGQIEFIEQMGCKTIIIDHHQYLKEKTTSDVLQINANLCGVNGNYEACGATLSYSIAKALDPKNIDLVSLAMAGATGDKQYIGGLRGYNKTVLDEGLKNGFLKQETSLKLSGKSLFDALYYAVDPYYSGISGNKKGVQELLEQLKLDKELKVEDLSSEQRKQLNSTLMFILIKKGCEKNILDTVIRNRYQSESLGCELECFADLLDSCGKGGNRGLGLSVCMGDKKAFEDAQNLEKDYKQDILDELIRLEKEGFEEKTSFKYFYSKESSLGGVIGSVAINFILGREKPLLSLVIKDGELHVSCRGNQYLVSRGLDLAFAMKEAARQLNGDGGGHAIASGATIDVEHEEKFLKLVDEIICKQLKM